MKLPTNTKPLIQGAAVGALLCATVGFVWGGWVTGSAARKEAAVAASNARVEALAPICAAQFRAQPDGKAKIAELVSASSWSRSGIVEKSGFATPMGSKEADSTVARACADLLTIPPKS
jgi:hypothetical protein